ncbi:MAG: hypothetical protein ACK45U_07320, partial [bacterium]
MRSNYLIKLLTVSTLLILINSDLTFASTNWWKDANQNASISSLKIERRMPSKFRSVKIDLNAINQKLFEVANNSSYKS